MLEKNDTAEALYDVLLRNGFVRCDIAACNCGSWHARHGWPERFAEVKDALQEAGAELDGVTALGALQALIAERDKMREGAERLEVARLRVQLEHALAHNAAESEDAARYVELRDHRLAHALRVWHNNADGGATGPLEGQHLDDAVDAAKTARLLVPYNVAGKRIAPAEIGKK